MKTIKTQLNEIMKTFEDMQVEFNEEIELQRSRKLPIGSYIIVKNFYIFQVRRKYIQIVDWYIFLQKHI